MESIIPLYNHFSESTAYPVEDYPYGRHRTRIRYWLEKDMKSEYGFRFVAQTEHPITKKWNNPKRSTYARLAGCMYLDEKKHVKWEGLSEFSSPKDVISFLKKFPDADRTFLDPFINHKIRILGMMVDGKAFFTLNDVRKLLTDPEKAKILEEVEEWTDIDTMQDPHEHGNNSVRSHPE